MPRRPGIEKPRFPLKPRCMIGSIWKRCPLIKVLHIDDCENDLELTKAALTSLSSEIEIEWAYSAAEGLTKLRRGEYDCVISDLRMPEMDGLELLRMVRSLYNRIPFILLTGEGDEHTASEAIRTGADEYYDKEGALDHFRQLLRSIYWHSRAKTFHAV
jgi:DNA-binding NtrC family response regulator